MLRKDGEVAMKCVMCPLYKWWNNESDRGESCGLFGGWDNPLQYEDKEGTMIGCYVDRHYIEKTDSKYHKHLKQETKRGKWILDDDDANSWKCSECGNLLLINDGTPCENGWYFCPHCGAKLKEQAVTWE